jgi:hypothetical protein
MTANYHDSICTIDKGFSYHGRIHPTSTHEPDNPYVRGILHPGNSSEVSGGVTSPGTTEDQDLWSEICQDSHLLHKKSNSKSEAPNPKQIKNLNVQMSQTIPFRYPIPLFKKFEFKNLNLFSPPPADRY